ncbi:NAD(P)H-binding protein [Tessaracoccus sp. OS52]|uniref:NAD(P)H-binding protein n=1 Tax=Tessaracoccus sp. OS52 TaxID=2886691 RepID=UPI00351CD8A8
MVQGDASEPADLDRALAGADVAWYLLHSMEQGGSFGDIERQMAESFAAAAREAGVGRLVYLGGLHPEGELSPHLRSRVEVGQILMDSGVPTAALQAGVVIGKDSISFRMLRHLSERLPGAIGPSWIRNRIQPIAVADLMHYLVAAADLEPSVNRTFDIGGPEALTYADMMVRYAAAVGLGPRIVLTAPVTTAHLAARWMGLVTPIRTTMARPLIGSLLNNTVVAERDLDDIVGAPPGGHTPFDDAVRAAVRDVDTRSWRRTLLATTGAVAAAATVGGLLGATGRSRGIVLPAVWAGVHADLAVMSALVLSDLADGGRDDERKAFTKILTANLVLTASHGLLGRSRSRALGAVLALLTAGSSAELVRRSAKASPERAFFLLPWAATTSLSAALRPRRPRRER